MRLRNYELHEPIYCQTFLIDLSQKECQVRGNLGQTIFESPFCRGHVTGSTSLVERVQHHKIPTVHLVKKGQVHSEKIYEMD